MSELVDMYILHKKRNGKCYKELAKSISWLDTRQFFPRSKTSSASLALDQTQMQPKIVMIKSDEYISGTRNPDFGTKWDRKSKEVQAQKTCEIK